MPVITSDKISQCLARISELRKRANAEPDPAARARLQDLELQWLSILDSYKLVKDANWFLNDLRRRSAATDGTPVRIRAEPPPSRMNGASLAELLEALVCVAIEHTDGKARAAFYLADPAGAELSHITGMPDAYARCVNGFAIGEKSLACGLAVAMRRPVITPDVSEEPRWKDWLWLAEEFRYRACWSFPIGTSSGKVLGSFAMYYEQPRHATSGDLDLASVLTRAAATIISRH
jgi:hypothetical protein